MLLFAIVHAQTTNSPPQLKQPIDSSKIKRAYYNYADSFYGPPPPLPFHTIPYVPSTPRTHLAPAHKWTNVFGFDDITYQSIFNEINGINYGIPTRMTPPPPTSIPSIYNNGYGFVNYAPQDLESAYISHDGRIVKQYSVHERHHNDLPDPNEFQPIARPPTQTISSQFPYFTRSGLNIAQPRNFFASQQAPLPAQNPNQIPTFLTKNHGPIALGSGSLGFIQLPGGGVYLGSGSLGYISHKDHFDNINEISSRRQKAHPRGPLTFGHSHL